MSLHYQRVKSKEIIYMSHRRQRRRWRRHRLTSWRWSDTGRWREAGQRSVGAHPPEVGCHPGEYPPLRRGPSQTPDR